jgi:hypothetical protein
MRAAGCSGFCAGATSANYFAELDTVLDAAAILLLSCGRLQSVLVVNLVTSMGPRLPCGTPLSMPWAEPGGPTLRCLFRVTRPDTCAPAYTPPRPLQVFPQLHILHQTRDGRDVACSNLNSTSRRMTQPYQRHYVKLISGAAAAAAAAAVSVEGRVQLSVRVPGVVGPSLSCYHLM